MSEDLHLMNLRSQELDRFIGALKSDIAERVIVGSAVHQVTDRIMGALQVPQKQATVVPGRQPVAAQLETVVQNLISQLESTEQPTHSSSMVVEHLLALVGLADQLAWWCRADSHQVGEPFASGHANATVIGKGGLEERTDVTIGISLLLPDIEYPEHHHPPEEVYVVLSAGQWQQERGPWHDPGYGGLVHNPPNFLHSMRSGPAPLLTTWCLWSGTR